MLIFILKLATKKKKKKNGTKYWIHTTEHTIQHHTAEQLVNANQKPVLTTTTTSDKWSNYKNIFFFLSYWINNENKFENKWQFKWTNKLIKVELKVYKK